MSRATKDEIAQATARRTEITNQLLELLTSDAFATTAELQRLRFVGSIFGIESVVQELAGQASSLDGRCELALSICMAALQIALDPTPPEPTARQLARNEARLESREAEKHLRDSLAGKTEPKK